MDKEEKKKLRKQLLNLLNAPNADPKEIKRIGKMLSADSCKGEYAERKANAKIGSRGFYKHKYVSPEVYIQLRNEGVSKAEIAEKLGIDMKKLHSEICIMRELGLIKKGDIPKYTKPLKFAMTREQYAIEEKIKTDAQIAREWGVSRPVVSNKRKHWGFPRRNIKVELTYDQYKEYKKRNMKDVEIEKLHGYPLMTIYRLKNEVWVMLDEL